MKIGSFFYTSEIKKQYNSDAQIKKRIRAGSNTKRKVKEGGSIGTKGEDTDLL